MSLNYNTELALINTTTNSGTITLPSAITVPGRVISFKDSAGNFLTNNFTLICDGSDTFEDGTTQKVFNESFGSIQVVASGTKWYILSGVRQNTMTISSLVVSTISTYSISFSDGSFQTVSADKNINSSIAGLGSIGYISSTQLFSTVSGIPNYLQPNITSSLEGLGSIGYLSSFNTISSLNISTGNLFANNVVGSTLSFFNISTNNITGFNLLGTTILSTQQIFCSSLQIGPTDAILDVLGPLRTQDISTVTCQASTVTSGTMTLDRLFGGPILNATTTQNLFPFSLGAQLGFYGSVGTGSTGFYSQINVRSTNTQVITPDIQGIYSNVIFMRGNVSSQNLNVSSVFGTLISTNTLATNILTTGGFTQRVVSSAVAPSGTVTLNLTSGNVFFFTTATPTATTVNFTTTNATVGSTYYVNFLSGTPTAAAVTFTGNTGATTLSITGLSLIGNPSVSIGLHGAAQSFTPAVNTRYMFTCIVVAA